VDELLNSQGIERQEVLVSRNGTIISGKHELSDGDTIKVFDVIAGG
jgi:thiamine biosynthesis protein ThiS